MCFTGSAIAKLASGDHALLGFDTKTTNPNHLLHAVVESSFLASKPGNRGSTMMMLFLKQRDGVKSFASYIEGSGEDVLNDANGLMLKGASVIKTFPSLQAGSTWLKNYAVLDDIFKPFESMVVALNKHTNMSPDAMNTITIGELAKFDPSKNPRFSYIGDDGYYVNNVRASAAATHDEFLEDQVNNDEVSLAVSNDDSESCYDHDYTLTATIPAASTPTTNAPAAVSATAPANVFATASVPDSAPSATASVPATVSLPAYDDTAVLIVHNLINGRVDVASELYLKFINTLSDEAKQLIFKYVREHVDEAVVPVCFPEFSDAGYIDDWWSGGGDVPPPMETPKTLECIDDGGGKPRAKEDQSVDLMVWKKSEMKGAVQNRTIFSPLHSSSMNKESQFPFEDDDSL
jgi:hypothetical protein